MSKYLYDNFIVNLAVKIRNRLDEISVDYNFDYGDEFEIAICELLRSFLPNKYGICRGFVVNKSGKKAGDDIIIYDQERFPTLKQISKEDWARKENIPIEAVYCYIEAKYSLDAGNSNDSNFQKAIQQVKDVKELVLQRGKYELNKYDTYHSVSEPKNFPYGISPYRNPVFTMIISRFVTKDKKYLNDRDEISGLINAFIKETRVGVHSPEGIVVGKSHYISTSVNHIIQNNPSRFVIPNAINQYMMIEKEDLSLAIGFVHLYAAIDWIRLDKMPWEEIFNDVKNN